jgi:hypothetical protein
MMQLRAIPVAFECLGCRRVTPLPERVSQVELATIPPCAWCGSAVAVVMERVEEGGARDPQR